MGFVAQWREIAAGLPTGWREARLRLAPARERDAGRAARLLGPLGPGRVGDDVFLVVTPAGSAGPAAVERLLGRLDGEGIGGTLELASATETAQAAAGNERSGETRAPSLAEGWDALVESLPDDWSDLLCLVELHSSDDLDRAALALAPVNPSRHRGGVAFRFRVARSYGYGAAPEMARRCLTRLDEQRIPGGVSLLEAFSDTRPLLTQGPTFVVDGRAV